MATPNDPAARRERRLVFISHAYEDRWAAERISEQIQAYGAETFLSEADLAVGVDLEQRILSALREADELLVLLTQH